MKASSNINKTARHLGLQVLDVRYSYGALGLTLVHLLDPIVPLGDIRSFYLILLDSILTLVTLVNSFLSSFFSFLGFSLLLCIRLLSLSQLLRKRLILLLLLGLVLIRLLGLVRSKSRSRSCCRFPIRT